MPKGTISRQIHIVDWEVDTYFLQDGKIESDWEMERQEPLGAVVNKYIEEANESEDQPLTDLEEKRLKDFVLYCQHRS